MGPQQTGQRRTIRHRQGRHTRVLNDLAHFFYPHLPARIVVVVAGRRLRWRQVRRKALTNPEIIDERAIKNIRSAAW
jgi:hypothetical protein